ncbi:uncharacterized protein LOC113757076 [Coffea eugenioides]|uniref:uncharacterized protein LOC113757076 n=1 Tax=Coffea eugenioides TaxID=49369 RepID=UPI000F609848|nr:uncharacterized protein LOC113757076 [Coffea eugenioides]
MGGNTLYDSSTITLHYEDYEGHHAVFSEEGIKTLRCIAATLSSRNELADCVQMYTEHRKDVVNLVYVRLHEKLKVETVCVFMCSNKLSEKTQRWIQVAKICVGTIFGIEKCFYEQIFGDLGSFEDSAANGFVLCFQTRTGPAGRTKNQPGIQSNSDNPKSKSLHRYHLKKQELASLTQSAKDALKAVEESVRREFAAAKSMNSHLNASSQSPTRGVAEQPSDACQNRAKIVITIQDKDGPKQFRVFVDDKFERLFKMYADKVKLDLQNLVFCFDGVKLVLLPPLLGLKIEMEENDIIEQMTNILSTTEKQVLRELSTRPFPGGGIHPLTKYIIHHIELIYVHRSTRVVKKKFKTFNSMFEDILQTQERWIVPDQQLRMKLLECILAKLIPAYNHFLERLSRVHKVKRVSEYIKYSVKDLETKVLDMFQNKY